MPRYGFNFQWMFIWRGNPPMPPDERALDFLASYGFDFVRIPTDYRFWIRDFDYLNPDETVLKFLDDYLAAYNRKRPHQGRGMNGRTPWQAFQDGLPGTGKPARIKSEEKRKVA